MSELERDVDALAADTGFSGVVRVELGGSSELEKAYGLAHRGLGIPNETDTRFGLASGAKGLTALVVVALIEEGLLDLSTPARSVLGGDLPLIRDDVTVEHLLAHRSGIGDYLDEDVDEYDVSEYLLPVPVHELAETEDYLAVLGGHATKFPPGERFSYSNGGYVVLALIAERSSGQPFRDLVRRRVCEPAGMVDTEFLRSDELPGRTAQGYLDPDGLRTNVLHLPVRGSGDGGVYSTAADIMALWRAFLAGEIVSPAWVEEMTRPRSDAPPKWRYGLGIWLDPATDALLLVGSDTGVSFRTAHLRSSDRTYTVVSNTSDGAWPIARFLHDRCGVS